MKVIIVGAGASGLSCAIKLKQQLSGAQVAVLERMPYPAKKILATGNGRCNITNKKALHYKETKEFFNSLGLMLREEESRMYPYSMKAETVAEILIQACRDLGIKIISECEVKEIDKNLQIISDKGIFNADIIVAAFGGTAQKSLGSNGSGYRILKGLGHTVTPIFPALVQLTSSSRYPRIIKGTRAKCNVSIEIENEIKGSEYGEVLFTDYGISGIAVMNLSHIASENFSKENPLKCRAVLDLIPDKSFSGLYEYIEKFKSLKGILGTTLSDIIMKQAGGDLKSAVKTAKNWKLIITGTKGFDFAQIAHGGIPLNEINNFKSKINERLYICGEILDEQYECGGFNLDFAWHSGITAANMIAKEYKNDKN